MSAEIEIKIDVHMFEFIAPSLCAETGEYTTDSGLLNWDNVSGSAPRLRV